MFIPNRGDRMPNLDSYLDEPQERDWSQPVKRTHPYERDCGCKGCVAVEAQKARNAAALEELMAEKGMFWCVTCKAAGTERVVHGGRYCAEHAMQTVAQKVEAR